MDFSPQTNQMPPSASPMAPASGSKSFLLIIAIVIVLAVAGGWFILTQWSSQSDITPPPTGAPLTASKPTPITQTQEVLDEAQPAIASLETVSPEKGVVAIKDDIDNTDLGSIDLELEAINKELQ